jgi:hypothetical protein
MFPDVIRCHLHDNLAPVKTVFQHSSSILMLETGRVLRHHSEDTLRSHTEKLWSSGYVSCRVEGKHDGPVKSVDASQICGKSIPPPDGFLQAKKGNETTMAWTQLWWILIKI